MQHTHVYHIGAPCVFAATPVGLLAHNRHVTPVPSAGPSQALLNVSTALLLCGLQANSSVNRNFPSMGVRIAGQAFVIIAVQQLAAPAVSGKVGVKLITLQNLGAPATATAAQGADAAIDEVGCQVVEDTTLEVADAEDVPEVGRVPRRSSSTTSALTSAGSADIGVLEGSDHVLEVVGGPEDVIVCKDHKLRVEHFGLKCSEQLRTLTKFLHRQASYEVAKPVRRYHGTRVLQMSLQKNDEDSLWPTIVDPLQAL